MWQSFVCFQVSMASEWHFHKALWLSLMGLFPKAHHGDTLYCQKKLLYILGKLPSESVSYGNWRLSNSKGVDVSYSLPYHTLSFVLSSVPLQMFWLNLAYGFFFFLSFFSVFLKWAFTFFSPSTYQTLLFAVNLSFLMTQECKHVQISFRHPYKICFLK